jgi:hypothetical protein
MSALDRYPDASDASPNFMYGPFDLSAPDAPSDPALGETLLALHLPERPPVGTPHLHPDPGPRTAQDRAFLFSVLAAQPYVSTADDQFLDLLMPRTG